MYSVTFYIYSVSSYLELLISYLYSLSTYFYSATSYVHSVSSYLYLATPYIYSVSSYLHSVTSYMYPVQPYFYSVTSYIYSVSSYFIQSSVSHLVSHTLWEDIVPHILPCSRFRNKKRCKNYILYNFIYFIDGTVKLLTDDVVNKSVVFRITETSHCSGLKMKETFLI